MVKIWENEEILNKMREFIEKVSKKEAVCECEYDTDCDEWFEYIEKEYRVNLTDYELEMLNEKFTKEQNKYMKTV